MVLEQASAMLGEEPLEDMREPVDAETTESTGAINRIGPFETLASNSEKQLRVVEPEVKVRDAAGLASNITQALTQYLLSAEQEVLHHAEYIRASVLDELERQRVSTESLIMLFADRLRQQDEALTSLRRELGVAIERLGRHSDLLRSLGEARGRDNALWHQFQDIVQRCAAILDAPSVTSHPLSLKKK